MTASFRTHKPRNDGNGTDFVVNQDNLLAMLFAIPVKCRYLYELALSNSSVL